MVTCISIKFGVDCLIFKLVFCTQKTHERTVLRDRPFGIKFSVLNGNFLTPQTPFFNLTHPKTPELPNGQNEPQRD